MSIAIGGICSGRETSICFDVRCPRVVIAGNATKGRCGQLRLGLLIPAAGSATLGDSVALSRSGSFQASGYLRRVDRRGNSEVAKRFGDRRRLGPESLVEGRDCLRFGEGSRPSTFFDIALIFARCKNFSC